MSKVCTKTGALVHFPEWGSYRRCDVYEVGGCFVLRCGLEYSPLNETAHARVRLGNGSVDFRDSYWTVVVTRDRLEQLSPWHPGPEVG